MSSESYDPHDKKNDYERAGVNEYIVYAARQQVVFWFRLADGAFVTSPPDPDGIYRSQRFPGLWLDAGALVQFDGKRLLDCLDQATDSPQHRAFIAQLDNR